MSQPRGQTQLLPTNEHLVARLFQRRRAVDAAELDPGDNKLQLAARTAEENATVELRRATLLVPEEQSIPVTGTGFGGRRVIWAFTDSEAYDAWRVRHDGAPTEHWGVPQVPGGKRDLGSLMEAAEVAGLMVNPAGPASLLATPEQYRSAQRTLIWTKPKIDEPLIAEGARGGARAELAERLQGAERALVAGHFDDFGTTSTEAGDAADRLGDTHSQSELIQLAAERSSLAGSDPPAVAARGWWEAARRWGLLGETRRCADDLMTTGRLALSALEAGTQPEKEEWFRQVLDFVAKNLPLLGLEDRAQDCREAQSWAERYPVAEGDR